ncbi:MAG: ATP-binding protein, partial [Prevotellaceae bacterium]|nr:ATP-binding protein [Prevotellaceae bacterium]
MNKNTPPSILNSRTEKVILELPNYAYWHTSDRDDKTHSFFLGRKSLIERLKNIIISASSTGVYLVTGNRGVGKSSLVNEVIEKTSLHKKSGFQYFNFLFLMFWIVLGLQVISNKIIEKPICFWYLISISILLLIIAVIIIYLIGRRSQFRKNTQKFTDIIIAAITDLFRLPNKSNLLLRENNILKMIVLSLVFLSISIFPFICIKLTTFKLFIIYI